MAPLYRYSLGGLRHIVYREPQEAAPPADNTYLTEDGSQSYVTEDGTNAYIPET